jgi:hypothetical protein
VTGEIDSHARFRDLISARLDAPLTAREQNELIAHLAACAGCRSVERDYREQRSRLRSLSASPPPREMWARTSAALDREMAAGGGYRPPADESGPSHGRRIVLTSMAAVGVVLALSIAQLPTNTPSNEPSAPLLMATPFGVPSQALAFLGSDEFGLALYRTRVDQVCPAAAPDCIHDDDIEPSFASLPPNLRPSNLALSPSGRQLSIVGRAPLEREDLIGVVAMPDTPAGPSRRFATLRPDLLPATPTPVLADEPSVSPGSGGQQPLTTAPPTDAIEGLTVLAIVEGVRSTGAPPAWSADGSMLAFSAMPADGSHGPDVYVWRPSDPLAQRVTNDHSSYFASWSGERIVVSRVDQAEPSDPISVETAVIDPRTGERRQVAAANLWLPAVSPLGSHAVSWFGSLEWKDLLVSPSNGALYVADWAALDPFDESVAGPLSPAPSKNPSTAEPASPSSKPMPSEPASTDPSEPASTEEPTLVPGQTERRQHDLSEPDPEPDESPVQSPGEALVPPAWLAAVEPDRDPQDSPVVDWQVRWSSDGKVLGYWVADAPGASWGRLVVLALDPQTGVVDHDVPLLEPTLAKRGFTLGLSRVAWVAPTESGTEGELLVRTWGLDGFGLLRLRRYELTEVMPAF